jgi:hypothetical protein
MPDGFDLLQIKGMESKFEKPSGKRIADPFNPCSDKVKTYSE